MSTRLTGKGIRRIKASRATTLHRSFVRPLLNGRLVHHSRPLTTPAAMDSPTRVLPDCWGHRGASSRFPENTLASFKAAMRDGAEGIESESANVHVSKDDVVIMFHDPDLSRTTDSKGAYLS
ncbi:hypothetical protein PLEOSDRAFT_1113425 [Pleurotus ostreatus PC15]|uniref:GP-PDE domain-containing protein n=1 Tax=Pleurotus ostreatus (strain PC15) TaxID=1137138 RepID=A0A067NMQ3_PLEO1|nr:hypothetical protein PLEOSDRAFT_1113425 [Pleurotus ostreatus PC15]